MKILLTGAQGQIGREIVDLLSSLSLPYSAFSKAQLDITDLQQIKAALRAYTPDVVINAAAYTAVDKAEQEPEKALAVNREGVKNIALVCKEQDIPLLHLSTDYVFDGNKPHPYVEEDRRSPLNVYGMSKTQGEIALEETWEKHIILRVSWVFGQYGHNFVKTILRLAAKEQELKIVDDQIGCPTAAQDIAKTLLALSMQITQGTPAWGIFHYSGDKATSWFNFANLILKQGKELFPLQAKQIYSIPTREFPTPARRPLRSVMSLEKIKKDYAIVPCKWEQALIQVLKQIQDQANHP